MGAYSFGQFHQTNQPLYESFPVAVEDAAWEHGHGGYTGTLAEKQSVAHIDPDKTYTVLEAVQRAEDLITAGDERIDDKWGPAGALRVVDPDRGNGWYYFGWASS